MWVPIGRSRYWCSKCKHKHIKTLNKGLPEYCPICGNDQYPIKQPKPLGGEIMSNKIEPFKTISVQVINPEFFEVGEAYRWVNNGGDIRTGICTEVKEDEVTFVTTGKPITMYATHIASGIVRDMRKLV